MDTDSAYVLKHITLLLTRPLANTCWQSVKLLSSEDAPQSWSSQVGQKEWGTAEPEGRV